MKKIVALVLSLVMVLGLATTAMAVDYDVYNANGKLVEDGTTYTVEDAVVVNALGEGAVEYVKLGCWPAAYFVECDKVDADYYVTIEGEKGAIMYLNEVKYVDFKVAAEFTDIGTACGQLNQNTKYDYYVYTNPVTAAKTFYQGTTDAKANAALLVNGDLVQVKELTGAKVNGHLWQIDAVNADHEVTDISCKLCKVTAKVYESKLAAPVGAIEDATYGWIVVGAAPVVEAPETDKVESAQTFDAGIAMYVGMSIMAAAGSAVVLKKKED